MHPFYFIVWGPGKILFKLYFRWELYGVENVPLQGGGLIVSNHASFLDPVLLGTSLPRSIHYLARKSLFKNKLISYVLRSVNAVPVDRDGNGMAGLKAILERLQSGCVVNLFPEGTRTLDGKLQKARSGVGLAVMKSNVPVIPTRIFGSFESYGRDALFPKPKKIIIKYGRPIDFNPLREEAKTCSKGRLRENYQ
jgi:1-acyl-sn-glycerol-3-phosphate acyltransferase